MNIARRCYRNRHAGGQHDVTWKRSSHKDSYLLKYVHPWWLYVDSKNIFKPCWIYYLFLKTWLTVFSRVICQSEYGQVFFICNLFCIFSSLLRRKCLLICCSHFCRAHRGGGRLIKGSKLRRSICLPSVCPSTMLTKTWITFQPCICL